MAQRARHRPAPARLDREAERQHSRVAERLSALRRPSWRGIEAGAATTRPRPPRRSGPRRGLGRHRRWQPPRRPSPGPAARGRAAQAADARPTCESARAERLAARAALELAAPSATAGGPPRAGAAKRIDALGRAAPRPTPRSPSAEPRRSRDPAAPAVLDEHRRRRAGPPRRSRRRAAPAPRQEHRRGATARSRRRSAVAGPRDARAAEERLEARRRATDRGRARRSAKASARIRALTRLRRSSIRRADASPPAPRSRPVSTSSGPSASAWARSICGPKRKPQEHGERLTTMRARARRPDRRHRAAAPGHRRAQPRRPRAPARRLRRGQRPFRSAVPAPVRRRHGRTAADRIGRSAGGRPRNLRPPAGQAPADHDAAVAAASRR